MDPERDRRAVDLQLATQVIALQEKELDHKRAELGLRGQELALSERENERAHQYALAALEVQRQEGLSHATVFSRLHLWGYLLAFFTIAILGFLAVSALYLGKAELVEKAMTHLVALGGGIGVGYALRSQKADSDKTPDNP